MSYANRVFERNQGAKGYAASLLRALRDGSKIPGTDLMEEARELEALLEPVRDQLKEENHG